MDVVHKRCAGLDVHKDEIVACARLGTGRRVEWIRARFSLQPFVCEVGAQAAVILIGAAPEDHVHRCAGDPPPMVVPVLMRELHSY